MSLYLHRGSFANEPAQRARQLAERIFTRVQVIGARQVRLYRGMLLTYPYPARRGYGTRGMLVGIYTINTQLEWIADDVLHALSDSRPCDSNQQGI